MIIPSRLAEFLSGLRERGEVRRAGGEWRTRCPAHDDDGPSLYLGLSPDRRCILLNCKAGCDAKDVVAAIGKTLDILFLDDDTEVEVDGKFSLLDPRPVAANRPGSAGEVAPEIEPEASGSEGTEPDPISSVAALAGIDFRHTVYERLLELLPLSPAHREDLRRRGLEDDQIDRHGYASIERFALNQAVGRLKEQFEEVSLLGVPGFRRDRGKVRFAERQGLLVPVRDLRGLIAALKLRRDDEGGPKYIWISSSDTNGPSPGSPPHVPLGTPDVAQAVRITEGELKADVSSVLSSLPTLGVSGVSNWRPVIPVLEEMDAGVVHLAFDSDATTKSGVASELDRCARGLIERGYEVRLERWDPADGKGIDDLLAAGRSPEVVAGQQVLAALAEIVSSACGAAPPDDEEDWVPRDPAEDIAPFPADCLPGPLRRFMAEVAESMQCPVDFLGLPMLAVAGGAIGGSRRVRIRRGYEEGPRIYGAVVARPGDGKSPALNAVCTPVFDRQNRRAEQFRRDLGRYEEELGAYEAARRSRRRGDDEPLDVPIRPSRPSMDQLYVENFTSEGLAPILARTPRGVTLIRDELSAWVRSMDQYRGGKGADRQFFLSCWSGEPTKVDRKSDLGESLIVPDPFLVVIGGIQPAMLPELDAGNGGEDGFIHRILFVYPKQVRARRWSWKGLSAETRQIWHDVVGRLYALGMAEDEHGAPAPLVLDLAPEAMPLWEGWYNRHAEEQESPDFPEALIGPWSKLVAYAARLALIVHLLRAACGEDLGEEVDVESLGRSFRLIDYFKAHARVVYSRLRQAPKAREVQKAIEWIRRHGGRCSPTDLARNNVAGVQKKSEAEALMKELEDRGYGRRETRTAANHRKVTWFVARTG